MVGVAIICCLAVLGILFLHGYMQVVHMLEVIRLHVVSSESFARTPRSLDVQSRPEFKGDNANGSSLVNRTATKYVGLRSAGLEVFDPRKFNLIAKLNLNGKASETGDLGNQMCIFHSTVGIANTHGMRPLFARNQLKLLNDVFDLAEHTLPTFKISVVEGDVEPTYPTRNAELWAPGKTYIDPVRSTKIHTYLQDANHFGHIFDEVGVPVRPGRFYRIRQRHVDAAKTILPGFPHYVALHV